MHEYEQKFVISTKLPESYVECENMKCSDCILKQFIYNKDCPYRQMLGFYKKLS